MASLTSKDLSSGSLSTQILPVTMANIGVSAALTSIPSWIDTWNLDPSNTSVDAQNLRRAAKELQSSNVPVAFPTETVYGLGADATRSAAVQGIYRAKQRPSDNPLIVHVWSLSQVRELLRPSDDDWQDTGSDPIPAIYTDLISKFWPGPLTLLVPNPERSRLAPEVTAGLSTFGVRMPRNPHALALLKLANVPLAAPSANASTKPSPTEAEHVKHDLEGRISTIIDGGSCDVGVESTVVDGLSHPPCVLRPGGISIDELQSCPGWENVTIGYKDISEKNSKPRAPGMKYKHYSPKAPVVLYEYTRDAPTVHDLEQYINETRRIGVIRTRTWPQALGLPIEEPSQNGMIPDNDKIRYQNGSVSAETTVLVDGEHNDALVHSPSSVKVSMYHCKLDGVRSVDVWEANLGSKAEEVARGLFAALRGLDKLEVDVIVVEGVDDSRGDVSAAVMNRLRKAAEIKA